MCRCLSYAVQFWITWSAWLLRLVLVSWVTTYLSNLALTFFWSCMTDLLKEFLRELGSTSFRVVSQPAGHSDL